MNTNKHLNSVSLITSALLFFLISSVAQANCNSPTKWLEAPGAEIKIFIGKQDSQNDMNGAESGLAEKAYPVLLPHTMLKNLGVGKLPSDEAGFISYYESDGKGELRICRVETWFPLGFGDQANTRALSPISRTYVERNPELAKITNGSVIAYAKLYFYDKKGRVERISEADFRYPERSPIDKSCRRYDENDRVVLEINPIFTKKCSAGAPDLRDEWLRLKFGDNRGELVTLLNMTHSGKEDGSWTEKLEPFRLGISSDAPSGNATIDSKNGVNLIFGSNFGRLDDNVANTVVDSFGNWNGATYSFISSPVSPQILEHPDMLYQYDRRRQTYVDGQIVKLFEFFRANEHISRHRYYMIDDYVLRHEQLDGAGKVVRVITIDDWRQPRPGPKPAVNDKLLSTHETALLAHQIFHRVYDIDPAGKPALVAVSWNRALRLNPAKKVPIAFADLVYGTPDGKIRWKTEGEFEKAFNTSAHAAHVFPQSRKSRNE